MSGVEEVEYLQHERDVVGNTEHDLAASLQVAGVAFDLRGGLWASRQRDETGEMIDSRVDNKLVVDGERGTERVDQDTVDVELVPAAQPNHLTLAG